MGAACDAERGSTHMGTVQTREEKERILVCYFRVPTPLTRSLLLKRIIAYNVLDLIYQTQKTVSRHISKVENTTGSRVFLTTFKVFRNVVKHCLLCLIYLLN